MRVQSPQERRKRIFQLREQLYTVTMKGFKSRLHGPIAPTEQEKNLVLTALILGVLSIPTALFPICGFPIAVAGLTMGLRGRRINALHTLATWAVALATVGLALVIVYITISAGSFLSRTMWG